MKIVGFLIILNSLALTAWWVCTDHQNKPFAISIGLVAIFAGVFLMIHERAIEISIDKVGTIKAAALQANEDAQAITELRNRIQNQSATVDLVADSASKAHKLIQELSEKNQKAEIKLQELDATAKSAQETLDKLKETAVFNSLVAAAQNDDRDAFEQLTEWTDKK